MTQTSSAIEIKPMAAYFDMDALRQRLTAVFDGMTEGDRKWHDYLCREYEDERAVSATTAYLAAMEVPQEYRNRSLKCTAESEGYYRRLLAEWQQMLDAKTQEASGRILLLSGKSGIGKTFFACWCLSQLALDLNGNRQPKVFGKYVSVHKVAREYKNADAKNAKTTREQVLRGIESCDGAEAEIFALDEIGLEKSLSQYERQFLYDFFDKKRRGVILCTNMSPPDLREFLGEAVYDRIHAACVCPKTSHLKSWRTEVNSAEAVALP